MAKLAHISVYNLNLEKAVLDMVKSIEQDGLKQYKPLKYCLFYPMIGKDYNDKKELIVYGQYVDNWTPTFKLTKDKKQIEALVKKAYEYSITKRGCPLDWVNKNWIKQQLYRSFFWNITYKLVMERFGCSEEDWNHIICYSNLVKIAPKTDDSYPPELYKAQLYNSGHLFKEELSILQPKNVLLITGLDNWAAPVFKAGGIKYTKHPENEFVEATTAYRGSNIIVTKKPFTADHRRFLDEVKRNMV